jgi:hypothetical protein
MNTPASVSGGTHDVLTAADWPSLLASASTVGSEPGHGFALTGRVASAENSVVVLDTSP